MSNSKEHWEKQGRLNKLFDNQIVTLKKLSCPEKVISLLKGLEDEVISLCLEIRTTNNRIPFLPVITPPYCTLEELMAMVRNKNEKGRVYPLAVQMTVGRYPVIDAVGSQPLQRIYVDPYYVIDVEDGTLTKKMEAMKAQKKIISAERSPLTTAESISLCIQTDVLLRHFLWTMGSRWGGEYRVPEINLTELGGTPQLSDEDIKNCHEPLWGTPSCKFRIG